MNNKVPYRKASFSHFYASLRDIRFSVSASLPRTGRPFYCVATPMAIGRTTNNRNHDARIWTVYSRIIAFENLKQTTCSCRRREPSLHNFSSFLSISIFSFFSIILSLCISLLLYFSNRSPFSTGEFQFRTDHAFVGDDIRSSTNCNSNL